MASIERPPRSKKSLPLPHLTTPSTLTVDLRVRHEVPGWLAAGAMPSPSPSGKVTAPSRLRALVCPARRGPSRSVRNVKGAGVRPRLRGSRAGGFTPKRSRNWIYARSQRPPGNGLWRSLSGWSETDRERGSAIGVLYCGRVGAGRAGRREHDDPVGGAVGGTGYERGTLGVRGDVLLWVALQASLMAECFTDGAGDSEGRIGVSELVGASHVSEHAADGDFGLCRAGRSSCRR
jgi:hypothetical protein